MSRQATFRSQLNTTVVFCIVLVVAIVTAASAWLTAARTESLMLSQGRTMVRQFADNSAAVLLIATGDESVMAQVTNAMALYPGVVAIDILDAAGRPVIRHAADVPQWNGAEVASLAPDEIRVTEDARLWRFASMVRSQSAGNPFQSRPLAREPLGYVHIAIDKAPARRLVMTIVAAGVAVAVVVGALFVWFATQRIRTMTQPLSELAGAMSQFSQGGPATPAVPRGPAEIANIARVFNDLIGRIQTHTTQLEEKVAMRTKELRTARDKALRAEQHKSEVMAMFTHEMRAPLHSIHAYVSHLRNELDFLKGDTAPSHRYLGVIDSESRALLSRINQILELSRLEEGRLEVNPRATDMPAFFRHAEEAARPVASANKNTINVDYVGPDRLDIDEDKLNQIVRNLLDNACKFTAGGRVSLRGTYRDGRLRIVVTDTGIGIPEAARLRIFEPFYQVDMSDSRTHQGTGLGLAIARQLCKLLGGRLRLESEVARGTTVRVTLPNVDSEQGKTAASTAEGET